MRTQPQEIIPIEADGNGSVAGFETTCACGLVMRNSLQSEIVLDAARHLDWHRANTCAVHGGQRRSDAPGRCYADDLDKRCDFLRRPRITVI